MKPSPDYQINALPRRPSDGVTAEPARPEESLEDDSLPAIAAENKLSAPAFSSPGEETGAGLVWFPGTAEMAGSLDSAGAGQAGRSGHHTRLS